MGLAVANHQESQWPAKERAAIHANTRNKLILKSSIDDVMIVARTLGVTPEDVAGLEQYEAIMRTPTGSPATVRTYPLPDPSVTPEAMRARSRREWGQAVNKTDRSRAARYSGSQQRRRPTIG